MVISFFFARVSSFCFLFVGILIFTTCIFKNCVCYNQINFDKIKYLWNIGIKLVKHKELFSTFDQWSPDAGFCPIGNHKLVRYGRKEQLYI
jgi:hypothetical protein